MSDSSSLSSTSTNTGVSGSFSASAEIPLPDMPDVDYIQRSDDSVDSLEHHEGNSSSASENAGHPDPEEEEKDRAQVEVLTAFEKDVFESVKNHSEHTFLRGIENFHAYCKKNLGKDHLEDVFVPEGSPDRDGNVYGEWKKGTRTIPGIPMMPWREVDQAEAMYAAFDFVQKVFYKPKVEKPRKVQRRKPVKEATKQKPKSKKSQ